jgi:cytochrome c peroxidase
MKRLSLLLLVGLLISSCQNAENGLVPTPDQNPLTESITTFGPAISFTQTDNYANQVIPRYITRNNTGQNAIQNRTATLGRVLFYDTNLSVDNSISCASCHKQEFAFSDPSVASKGVLGGTTVRHSMRLINARFAQESKFFWNERAASLEAQSTMPIQDHLEMGFSGQNGRADMAALLKKLAAIPYYKEIFTWAYGDANVTEARLQQSLAQFIRSIQSFDSKYDVGRAQVANENQAFPNFTAEENQGKTLFLTPPVFNNQAQRTGGGLGCQGCHRAPEFDIDPNSRNNGVIGVIGSNAQDQGNTRAPSLRDLVNPNGQPNSPMMHTGGFATLESMLAHYNSINNVRNQNLDRRLQTNNIGQKLNMTPAEISAVAQFLRTLTGKNVYTDKKWGDPFR